MKMSALSPATSPTGIISCLPIGSFDPSDWSQVDLAFEPLPALEMVQAWLPALETDFRPSRVRIGWREDQLYVLADLEDADISTTATLPQQLLWTLGDTFEIFLRLASLERYHELHVAPNNLTLQFRFEDAFVYSGVTREGLPVERDTLLFDPPLMSTWTRVSAEDQSWSVLAVINLAALVAPDPLLPDAEWLFSLSRYDYTTGRARPVISSTSLHYSRNFHTQSEWRTFVRSE